jgi:hypothetical protein
MKTSWALFFKLIAAVITFGVLYTLVYIYLFYNAAMSVEPGWHTTIYSPYAILTGIAGTYPSYEALKVTSLISLCTILNYFLFKYLLRFFAYIWLKIYPLRAD